jgi:hypothetical protein
MKCPLAWKEDSKTGRAGHLLDTYLLNSSVRENADVSEEFDKLPNAKQLLSGEPAFESDFSLHCHTLGNGHFLGEPRSKQNSVKGVTRLCNLCQEFHFVTP